MESFQDFAFGLFKAGNKAGNETVKRENFIISPLSAYISMSMIANGASDEVSEELLDVLGFSKSDIGQLNSFNKKLSEELKEVDISTKFSIANSVWHDKKIQAHQSFCQTMTEHYDADVLMPTFIKSTCMGRRPKT